jgi:hypothetical protein
LANRASDGTNAQGYAAWQAPPVSPHLGQDFSSLLLWTSSHIEPIVSGGQPTGIRSNLIIPHINSKTQKVVQRSPNYNNYKMGDLSKTLK